MKQTPPFQLQDTEQCLPENGRVHFGGTQHPVDKDDRHFDNLEPTDVSREFHLNLESIPLEMDMIQVDGLQYAPTIAFKPSRRVMYLHTGHPTDINRGKVGHQHTS